MKKKIYTTPHLEELSVEDMQLLVGTPEVPGTAGGFEPGEGDPASEEDEREP